MICDSHLRIPLDSRICRTAAQQETIVACACEDSEKRAALEQLGITVLCLPGGDGRVDLNALMDALGAREIDSVLIEGGSEIHAAALEANIVRACTPISARSCSRRTAPSPIGGAAPLR